MKTSTDILSNRKESDCVSCFQFIFRPKIIVYVGVPISYHCTELSTFTVGLVHVLSKPTGVSSIMMSLAY